eukprot:TRINITY_DN64296_c0_g1_i4.p4 TRINITY_DN64296_c0_g1~~TRINITY_DN64296_c0_g1_i4.p4  ORF type:complete len:100 (+),score=4.60 TRINITY_DN64296_c0_g1_i4:751-1050(+)
MNRNFTGLLSYSTALLKLSGCGNQQHQAPLLQSRCHRGLPPVGSVSSPPNNAPASFQERNPNSIAFLTVSMTSTPTTGSGTIPISFIFLLQCFPNPTKL